MGVEWDSVQKELNGMAKVTLQTGPIPGQNV